MLIENESQWNTDDLKAIVAAVLKHEGKTEADFRPDFLLLFKTSRQRHYDYTGGPRMRAAQVGYYRGGLGGNAKVIDLRSKAKLVEKNLLDRLAIAAESSVTQDIHPQFIRDIAETIGTLLLRNSCVYEPVKGYEFAEKLQLRSIPKITRCTEITRRKIEQIESEKDRIGRHWTAEIQKMDEQIARLKRSLSSDETGPE